MQPAVLLVKRHSKLERATRQVGTLKITLDNMSAPVQKWNTEARSLVFFNY